MADSTRGASEEGFGVLIAALAALRNDRLQGQPSDRTLAKAAGVSPSTIGEWLRGSRFPQQIEPLLEALRAVRAQAVRARQADDLADVLLDEQQWRDAYRVEARRRAAGTRVAVQAEQGRAVLEQMRPGRPLDEVNDPFRFDLEVHRAIDPGDPGLPSLPVYVPRAHDQSLAEVIAGAADGASGIAVLVGGSSVGKTRACWEALDLLRGREEPWRLWHPIYPTHFDATLADLRNVAPYTVVWLNEAQRFLAPEKVGEQVAAGLRELLRQPGRGPVLVLATLWPQHWDVLTTRPHPGQSDPHAQARELLNTYKINVPDAFTGTDLAALTCRAGHDPRLREAAEHAEGGQVTQYLAGVPLLLNRYDQAPAATKAVVHAAMDARRLGAGPYLPLALLADAAPGYLAEAQWQQAGDDWLQQALDYAATPCNGIPGILTPVKTGTPRNQRNRRTHPAGTAGPPQVRAAFGPRYRLADYLDQHGERHRGDQIPPIDFWTAAAAHAHPADLATLGNAAWMRGLYRDAAQLHKYATSHGSADAATELVRHMHHLHPADRRPAQHAARQAALDDPDAVAQLLKSLREAEAEDQVATLLARNPAVHVSLNDSSSVARLLESLRGAGAADQVLVLAERAAAHAPINHPDSVARLLANLREAGAADQAAALAERAAVHTSLNNPGPVGLLLNGLREARAEDQVATLLARDPAAHANLDHPFAVALLLHSLRGTGAKDQLDALLARNPAAHVTLDNGLLVTKLLESLREVGAEDQVIVLTERIAEQAALDDPFSVALLLESLREVGAEEQVVTLLARDPAAHAPLDNLSGVARLLTSLHEARAEHQVIALLDRDPAAHAPLDDPFSVALLLESLREVGAEEQVIALLARDPAAHVAIDNQFSVSRLMVSLWEVGAEEQTTALAERAAAHALLDHPSAVTRLLESLREVGAEEQVTALTERLPAAGLFDMYIKIDDLQELFRFGREPDGSAADPWEWDDLK